MVDLPANAAAAELQLKPLTVTIPVALNIIGLGRTKFYQLLDDGTIESITIGRRRLVNYESLQLLASGGRRLRPPALIR
jgi:excisionase family DNA binding protein